MFPALISEFISAEQEYRNARSHRYFLERDYRRSARARRAATEEQRGSSRPTAGRTAWTARSA